MQYMTISAVTFYRHYNTMHYITLKRYLSRHITKVSKKKTKQFLTGL